MLRPLLTSAFATVLFLATASAQDHLIKHVDTEAMRLSAAKRTAQLDRVVGLSDEQRGKVSDFYMGLERQLDVIDQRYTVVGLAPEEKKAEMNIVVASLKRYEDQMMPELLTAEQLVKLRGGN